MGKHRRERRKVWIEADMFASEAYRTLPASAMWVLQRFHQKMKWTTMKRGRENYRIYERNGLRFPYSEARDYGWSDATFYRAIRALCDRGFIDIIHRGGAFGVSSFKDYSTYSMSERWRKWNTEDFVEGDFKPLSPRRKKIGN